MYNCFAILHFRQNIRTSSAGLSSGGNRDRPRGAGLLSPSSLYRVWAAVTVSVLRVPITGDSTASSSLWEQTPHWSPQRLGKNSTFTVEGWPRPRTVLFKGTRLSQKPGGCRASFPQRSPELPSLGSISFSKLQNCSLLATDCLFWNSRNIPIVTVTVLTFYRIPCVIQLQWIQYRCIYYNNVIYGHVPLNNRDTCEQGVLGQLSLRPHHAAHSHLRGTAHCTPKLCGSAAAPGPPACAAGGHTEHRRVNEAQASTSGDDAVRETHRRRPRPPGPTHCAAADVLFLSWKSTL